MRISFDLDGTAWKYREIFSKLAHLFKSSGHEVGILTAHGENLRQRDLELWLARGFPHPDFAFYHNNNATPVSIWKAEVMADEWIDIHFEDFDGKDIYESLMLDAMEHGFVVRIR
jgi:hypothetical protein